MQEAVEQGLSAHIDTDGQIVIMFRPDFIGLYAENPTALHQATTRTLQRVAQSYKQSPARPIVMNRQKIRVTNIEYLRSPCSGKRYWEHTHTDVQCAGFNWTLSMPLILCRTPTHKGMM